MAHAVSAAGKAKKPHYLQFKQVLNAQYTGHK